MWSLYTLGDHSPARSTCALAGRPGNINSKSSRNVLDLISSSPSAWFVGATRRRVPPGRVRNLLEVRVHDERFYQVSRIGDHRGHHEPGVVRVRVRERIEVFLQERVAAVRHTVLLQISRTHSVGHHLEIIRFLPLFPCDDQPARWILDRPALAVTPIPWFASAPHRHRVPLPRRRFIRRRGPSETEEASLGPGIRIHTERAVVLPIDVQPPRHLQESGSTVRPACLTARLILDWIPGARDFATFGVERNLHVIALVRHDHTVTPLFGDLRHPVSGHIVRGGRARGSGRSTLRRGWTL